MRIIIDNRSPLPDTDAISYVAHVVSGGRVSNNEQCYCYVTTWPNGVVVQAKRNLNSDTFTVTKKEGTNATTS